MNNFTVRRFEEKDAEDVSALIIGTSRAIHSKVYEAPVLEAFFETVSPENIIERAKHTHYYVICDGDRIICSGAVGRHDGLCDESEFFNIFLLPEYQGKGLGRLIVETLEKDEYCLNSKRIFIHSSLTALKFYKRMGYDHVNGEFEIDDDQLYRLEKFL